MMILPYKILTLLWKSLKQMNKFINFLRVDPLDQPLLLKLTKKYYGILLLYHDTLHIDANERTN